MLSATGAGRPVTRAGRHRWWRPGMALKHPDGPGRHASEQDWPPLFGLEPGRLSRHSLGQSEMAPDLAYQIIHDELMLDGNARLNLATFVTTWAEPQAERLMAECLDKNMIDKDEYPATAELEVRCVNILSQLWHAPDAAEATGCSTTGSSEAAMLGGLALKRRWQKARAAAGKPPARPNIVMGINVQVCWEKLANYWDIDMRLVPMEGNRFHLSPEEAVKACDENTIGVVAILGSTYDGSYEPVADICAALDDYQARTGIDVPVHVRGAAALPEDLIFWCNYLGDNMPTFALNFSRPGAQVVMQYYNFLRLGFDGYRAVQQYSRDVATHLSAHIAELGPFELITRGDELPVMAFKLRDDIDNYTVFDVSNGLRERGWLVPAYTFPKNREDLAALRGAVKSDVTHDMADFLVNDLKRLL